MKLLKVAIFFLLFAGCSKDNAPEDFSFSLMGRQVVPNSGRLPLLSKTFLIVDGGQSNMQANSQQSEFDASANVTMVNNTRRGPAYMFGILYSQDHPDTKVIVLSCAQGGTSIDQWQRGTPLYQACINLIHQQPVPPSVFLWQQGEQEASQPLPDTAFIWTAKFLRFWDDFRSDIALPNLKIFYGRLGDNYFNFPPWENIREQQAVMVVPNGRMVSMDGIELDKANYIHFTDAGYAEAGRRYYQAWKLEA